MGRRKPRQEIKSLIKSLEAGRNEWERTEVGSFSAVFGGRVFDRVWSVSKGNGRREETGEGGFRGER